MMNKKKSIFLFIIALPILTIIISFSGISLSLCQYSSSATATSQQANFLAKYAAGPPDSDGECTTAKSGLSWAPASWGDHAILELTFQTPVTPKNFTIFGDQGMSWETMWIFNDDAQQWVLVNSFSNTCKHTQILNNLNFKTSKIKLIKTTWDWSAADAVQLCGEVLQLPNPVCGNSILETREQCDDGNTLNNDGCSSICQIEQIPSYENDITICDWQNCKKGAASISIDDSHTACREELNKNNFKGTYYLSYTNTFSPSDWNTWQNIYDEGHEIGGHTRSHSCLIQSASSLKFQIESNKNDILSHVNIPEEEFSSFAWPCGVYNDVMKKTASNYFISARGYHINQLEEKNPADFMNLKSLNTPHFHSASLDPPNYFTMADLAEEQEKWVNYVFHNECEDDGAIDYLKTKDLWVAPIGKVVKYILERQNTEIQNLLVSESEKSFDIITPLNSRLFNQEISFKINLGQNNFFGTVEVNDNRINYVKDENYIIFNVKPSGNDSVGISNTPPLAICGNSIKEIGEQCDDGNENNDDSCTNLCNDAVCGDDLIYNLVEACDDGNKNNEDNCSNQCHVKIGKQVYLVPYVGDIDGSVSEDWFFFYKKIADFYINNHINAGFSFFPGLLLNNSEFKNAFLDMYSSPNIELIQKGNLGDDIEYQMDSLSLEQQKSIIKKGQENFRSYMQSHGISQVILPLTYDQIGARFTETTLKAVEDLGFKTYFDLYLGDGLLPVSSTENFDVLQYGISFTTDGSPGRETKFKSFDQLINDIKAFNRTDVEIMKINGIDVIPFWVHQQDFEDPIIDNKLDLDKWEFYSFILKEFQNNSETILLAPNEVYNLRHQRAQQLSLCQYSSSATATSQQADFLAKYAAGPPDSDGECTTAKSGLSWAPASWGDHAMLELTFQTPVTPKNFTIFGDQGMSWETMWIFNDDAQQWVLVNSFSNTCKHTQILNNLNFKTSKIKLIKTTWDWSAADAVQLCGSF